MMAMTPEERRERERVYQHTWYMRNRDSKNAKSSIRRAARRAAWSEKDREAERERRRAYYAKNAVRLAAADRAYRAKNPKVRVKVRV
jgi:hypothetical protein